MTNCRAARWLGCALMTTAALTACTDATATDATAADATAPPSPATSVPSTVGVSPTTAADATGTTAAVAASTVATGPATGEPILIGTIYTDASGVQLADNVNAMESLFAAWNATGGVAGRPLELVAENGGLDPGSTATAARKLVDEAGVVAMVLSLSPVDCQANGQYYEQEQIAVLFQISDECAGLDVTFPNGAAQAAALAIPVHYAASERQARRFAYVGADVPSSRSEADTVRAKAEADGGELVLEEYVPLFGADAGGVLARIAQAGADAVLISINPTDVATFLAAASTQGIGLDSDVTWIASPVAYDENLIAPLSTSGDGLLTYTPTVPFTDPAVSDYVEIWRAGDHGRPMTGMVGNAWMAADVLRQLLESIDGEITRASVLAAAAASTDRFESDVSPIPIEMSPPDATALAGYVIELRDGELMPISDVITLP